MKHVFVLSISLFIMAASAQAQTAKKFVLLERFTNTYCGLCAVHNPTADAIVNANRDDVHHLVYYPSVPYNQCPIYQSNVPDYGTRQSFYNVPGTPRMYYLGIYSGSGSNMISQSDIDIQQGLTADLRLKVNESISGSTVSVTTTMDVFDNVPSGDLRLFVAAVEADYYFPAANGEQNHMDVMRTFLTPNTGTQLSGLSIGSSQTFSHNYTVDPNWDINEMYIIAWVQNFTTNEILNSGSTNDIIIDLQNMADESCAGLNDGAISINVTGGENNNYNINWSNGASGTTVTGLAPGTYAVSIDNGVQASFSEFTIAAGTTASAVFNSVPPLVSSSSPISLSASPAGGVFSGTGVIGNAFNPAMSGSGLHTISYSYTDALGCTYQAQSSIFVFDLNYFFINYSSETISP